LTETTEGNGADQPRRAKSSTERSRAHRARKKAEREAALQAALRRAEADREATLKVNAERVADAKATETATAEAVAPAVACVAETVASAENDCGNVPAVPSPVKWSVVWRAAWRPSVPVLYRWTFGGMSVALSFALYFISTFLNMTFWANLNPELTAKEILAAGGLVVELINYTVPSTVAFVPSSQRGLRLAVWAVLCVTMVATAVAGAGVVKNSLGASQVSRKQIIEERDRLQRIIDTPLAPVSDTSVVAAREKRDTAKAVARSDCPKNKSLDLELCNKSKAAWVKAEADLTLVSEKHDAAVTAAEQQHRKDVADAKAELDRLPVISIDLDIVAAGVNAIMPGVEEASVTRGVVALWVLLFSLGPCALLRLGLALLAPTRWRSA
jgi:hypothetical protein